MFPYHSRTLKVVLGFFFLMHSFTLISIIFIQLFDRAKILPNVFIGLVLYWVEAIVRDLH
jgi:ABC-type tungstate transport system substrate-binding protein